MRKSTPSKVKQSTQMDRTQKTLRSQVSMNDRMQKARLVFEDDADQRDLSPSQRERYVDEEVKAY